MIKIDGRLISDISTRAKSSPRKRCNYNFHKDYSDPVQRMINAMEPGTYIRPHKHESPDKTEVFIILKGRAAAVEFDNSGIITDYAVLHSSGGSYGVEFPPKSWHSFLVLEPGTVLYEVKDGPYVVSSDKGFAPWAPGEGSLESGNFMNDILKWLKEKGVKL